MATTAKPATTRKTDDVQPAGRSGQRALAAGLAALALGLIINTVAGPLVADVVDYPVSTSMRNQTIGLDAAALFLFAPACLVVALLAWQGHRASPLLALGLGSYVAYIFVQYFAGPQFDYYPGTMVLHLGLFVGGWALSVQAWTLGRRDFGGGSPLSARHAAAAFGLAGFVVLRYVPGLVASLNQDSLPAEVSGDVTMYWLIVLSDLGIFVPLTLATAVGVLRAASWARLALLVIVGWFTMVSIAVGTMSLTMVINHDPYASRGQLGLFIATTAVALGYAIHLHRGLLDRSPPGGAPAGEPAAGG